MLLFFILPLAVIFIYRGTDVEGRVQFIFITLNTVGFEGLVIQISLQILPREET